MPTSPPNAWTARLAWAVLLLLVGAGLAVWGLARWQAGAQFLGVAPAPSAPRVVSVPQPVAAPSPAAAAVPDEAARLAGIEARLSNVENATQQAAGSAGRADNLLVAFAARRAIERGMPLGYLEPLLVQRFGPSQQAAVTGVISAGRQPDTLDQLTGDYQALQASVEGPSPNEDFWTGFKRGLGELVSIRRTDRPSPAPAARFGRALDALKGGKVAVALAETLRMPGAGRPEVKAWIDRARRMAGVEAALDQLESQALLGGAPSATSVPSAPGGPQAK
ncbi:hypothetical protein ABDK56_08420 [Sphingomonas sp. ASV193]|uniref:hypothetical protein n=1 Tax=Sphingomonas sp. ASV193 TaxID=3144405 RepID=UPI0032E87B2C